MTTQAPPLNASPLSIIRHHFTDVRVNAREDVEGDKSTSLDFSREWAHADNDNRKWRMKLGIKFGALEDGEKPPYEGEIGIEGFFEVAPSYPEQKISELIEVTGASILYGACREMIANITARSSLGMISLPSISFASPAPEPTKKSRSKE